MRSAAHCIAPRGRAGGTQSRVWGGHALVVALLGQRQQGVRERGGGDRLHDGRDDEVERRVLRTSDGQHRRLDAGAGELVGQPGDVAALCRGRGRVVGARRASVAPASRLASNRLASSPAGSPPTIASARTPAVDTSAAIGPSASSQPLTKPAAASPSCGGTKPTSTGRPA